MSTSPNDLTCQAGDNCWYSVQVSLMIVFMTNTWNNFDEKEGYRWLRNFLNCAQT